MVFHDVFFVSFPPFILIALCKSYIVFVHFCTEIIWDTQTKYITHKSICCIHSRFIHMFSIYAVALNLTISVRARWIHIVFLTWSLTQFTSKSQWGMKQQSKASSNQTAKSRGKERKREKKNNKIMNKRHCIYKKIFKHCNIF